MTNNGIKQLESIFRTMQVGNGVFIEKKGNFGTGVALEVQGYRIPLKLENGELGDPPPTNQELDAMPSDKPVEYHEDGSPK